MTKTELKQLQLLLLKYKKESHNLDLELEYCINGVIYEVTQDLE